MTRPKREKTIKVKMFHNEYLTAQIKALQAGYPLATYARNAILNKQIYDKKELQITAQYLAQFAWIGNNINQIARALNILTQPSKEQKTLDLAELNIQLDDIRNELHILREIVQNSLGVDKKNDN